MPSRSPGFEARCPLQSVLGLRGEGPWLPTKRGGFDSRRMLQNLLRGGRAVMHPAVNRTPKGIAGSIPACAARHAPLAQLRRAAVLQTVGWGFESLVGHQNWKVARCGAQPVSKTGPLLRGDGSTPSPSARHASLAQRQSTPLSRDRPTVRSRHEAPEQLETRVRIPPCPA